MNRLKEVKDRLYNYSKIIAEKKELDLRYQELESNIGINAIETSEGKSYSISKITEVQAVKLAEHKEYIEKYIKAKRIEIERVENALNYLSDKEIEVIKLIYIKQLRIETVAVKLDRSYKTIKKIESNALKKMDSIINYKIPMKFQ